MRIKPVLAKDALSVENIKLIDNIIQYTGKNKMSGLLLFVDFKKRSVRWSGTS